MNPTGKKFISLFLVFSLMMLSVNLYAKKRQGAKLIITNMNGQWIGGELISVKENSLLLLDSKGKDVSIDIADIKYIAFDVKKSKVGKGALFGLLFGIAGGLVGGLVFSGSEDFGFLGGAAIVTMLSAPGCALIGALIGAAAGERDVKPIQIEGMTDSEIRDTLYQLSNKARVRDYESYLRTKPKIEREEVKDTLQPVKEGDIIPLGSVDIPPVLIKKVIPPYPRAAKKLKREGTVILNVLISEKGEVLNIYILKGIKGSIELNEAAQNAVQQWKFQPAMKDGVPVKVWKQITFKFSEK